MSMGLRINTNIASINVQRNLSRASMELLRSGMRLSTGLRIVTAADDAAGLAISERLRAQIRSLAQAERNASDGISLVQTGEGALEEVNNILSRMRELAVQSTNGTVSSTDRTTLHSEFNELRAEVDRIANSTEFNTINLLDGSATTISFQVGIGVDPAANAISMSFTPALATSLGLDALNISSAGGASTAIAAVDSAINSVSGLRANFGAIQNRLGSSISHLGNSRENLTAAESRIRDVDMAFETAQYTRNSILQQTAISVLAQANMLPSKTLSLFKW